MAITREDMVTLIPNTTMQKVFINGVHKLYEATPNDGYVLHDKVGDMTDIDPETGEEFVVSLRYGTQPMQVNENYDFTPKEMLVDGMSVTAYGDREFFAIKKGDD